LPLENVERGIDETILVSRRSCVGQRRRSVSDTFKSIVENESSEFVMYSLDQRAGRRLNALICPVSKTFVD